MTTLVWDGVGERFYETGISRGVFYDSLGVGTAWNGLISVAEDSELEMEPVYFDGMKINDIVTLSDYAGTLTAFTYPDEFLPYEGIVEDEAGFFLTDQPYGRFGLSYRTTIGDDVQGMSAYYKVHVIYNLTAVPSQKSYQTLSEEPSPHNFEWTISAIPEDIGMYRPTAHLIFDNRKIAPEVLQQIENVLYGTVTADAYLPSMSELIKMIKDWIADI